MAFHLALDMFTGLLRTMQNLPVYVHFKGGRVVLKPHGVLPSEHMASALLAQHQPRYIFAPVLRHRAALRNRGGHISIEDAGSLYGPCLAFRAKLPGLSGDVILGEFQSVFTSASILAPLEHFVPVVVYAAAGGMLLMLVKDCEQRRFLQWAFWGYVALLLPATVLILAGSHVYEFVVIVYMLLFAELILRKAETCQEGLRQVESFELERALSTSSD